MMHSISTQSNQNRTIAQALSFSNNNSIAAICLAFAVSMFASNAYAEAGKTVLVLDASGSMWEKISDGYKISVARNVVNDMLETQPAEHKFGLVAYGHRNTGDCNDIELLVPPAADNRKAISSAIESLNPTGKTPLSAAVIKAADELGSGATNATVILISDGEETCNMDPCLVSAELEKKGIDFIAHVVGFDVKKAADQDQLRCLAENTGGLFFSADSALELTQSLNKISFAMSEAAKQVQLTATVHDHDSTPVRTGIVWKLTPIFATDEDATTTKINLLSDEKRTAEKLQEVLDLGRYTLTVTRDSDGVSTSLDLDLTNTEVAEYVLTLPPKASIEGPITVSIGEIFDVQWEGPGDADDLIAVTNSANPAAQVISVFTADSTKSTTIRAPIEPGEYQLRYVYAAQRSVIATSILNVVDTPTTLGAPDQADAGYLVAVDWAGPDDTNDAIVVAEVGAAESINETATYLGNPAIVQMPIKPGTYEIRYVLHEDRKVLASRLITVVEGAIKLNAPNEAGVGETIVVHWTGPNEPDGVIAVGEAGAIKNLNSTDTLLGNPTELQMPTQPGNYEIRYVLRQGQSVMASQPITVNDAEVQPNVSEQANVDDLVNKAANEPSAGESDVVE